MKVVAGGLKEVRSLLGDALFSVRPFVKRSHGLLSHLDDQARQDEPNWALARM